MRRPLLLLASCLALGCLIGDGVGPPAAALLLALAAGQLGLALAAPRGGPATLALGAAAVAIGAAGAGVERAAYEASPLLAWVRQHGSPETPVRLRGIARQDGLERPERWTLALDVEELRDGGGRHPLRGGARVQVGGGAPRPTVAQGDRIALWATLREPRSFANPGSPDREAAARRDGLHVLGHCKSALLVERGPSEGVSPTAAARAWARGRLASLLPPGPEEGVVRAMVLGDRSGIDDETAESFRIAGTYHVLAISGTHVALVAGLLLGAGQLLGAPRALLALAVSGALVFYAGFVGGQPPVLRAATMAVVMLLGRCLDLDVDLANLLGLAGGVLLAHHPLTAGDVGFQLSFTATLGILLLAPPLVARLPRLPFRLELALAASLAAQLPLAPLLALHFHRLAPAALLLNLLAVPLSGAVLAAGLVALLAAGAAPLAASLLAGAAWIAAHALLATGRIASAGGALDVRVPAPGVLAVALVLAGLVVWPRRLRLGAAFALLGVAGLLVGPGGPAGDGRLYLTVLDVGQGDALVLRSPAGRVRVVDAGAAWEGGFDAGESVVAPYLWSEGVARIDGLLITHAHPDHAGGAASLLRAMRVGEVWEGPAPAADETYRRLAETLGRAGARRLSVARGMHFTWDGVAIDVVGPRPRGRPWRARNDDSVVALLSLGGVRFLLAADAEAAEEGELPALPVALLKVPHHGSRTSSGAGFVAVTRPLVAVVSAGLHNRFGHPHAEVVERYLEVGARLYRTDRDGAVTAATDGSRLWVRTFRGGTWERVR